MGEPIEIRTAEQVIKAHERVFNRLNNGEIKEGTANALSAQLRGIANIYKLKIDAARVMIEAEKKGVKLPKLLEGEK